MKIFAAIVFFMCVDFSWLEANAYSQDTSVNPMKSEMRLLNDAFVNLVQSIVMNVPEAIEEPFHKVREAEKETERALEKGEIRLPKNGDDIKSFAKLDRQFHGKLEELIKASRKKDMKAVTRLTSDLLNGCLNCHQRFRD